MIALATLLGVAIDWSPVNPMKALFWSAVINGVVATPMMAAMMLVASRRGQMADFAAGRRMQALGWVATAAMAASVIAMIASFVF